jgi:hypothetical protein
MAKQKLTTETSRDCHDDSQRKSAYSFQIRDSASVEAGLTRWIPGFSLKKLLIFGEIYSIDELLLPSNGSGLENPSKQTSILASVQKIFRSSGWT